MGLLSGRDGPALFSLFFPGAIQQLADEGNAATASSLHWGALVAAILISFTTTGRKQNAWENLARRFPRFTGFLASGYGLSGLTRSAILSITRLGIGLEWVLNQKLWKTWLPLFFQQPLRTLADVGVLLDRSITRGLGRIVGAGVEMPAKGMQFIQNGDVRWYLLFAVGSGFLILLHFARIFG